MRGSGCSARTKERGVSLSVLLALKSGRGGFKTKLCCLLSSLIFFTCKMVLLETPFQGYCDDKIVDECHLALREKVPMPMSSLLSSCHPPRPPLPLTCNHLCALCRQIQMYVCVWLIFLLLNPCYVIGAGKKGIWDVNLHRSAAVALSSSMTHQVAATKGIRCGLSISCSTLV